MSPNAFKDGVPVVSDASASASHQARYIAPSIVVIVVGAILLISALVVAGLVAQLQNYRVGLQLATNAAGRPDHAAVLGYARAFDFGVTKTASLLLSFLLIFLGGLYVLRSADSSYTLSLEGKEPRGSLQTSSPGLVILTLGVVLVICAILKENKVTYEPASSDSTSATSGNLPPRGKIDTSGAVAVREAPAALDEADVRAVNTVLDFSATCDASMSQAKCQALQRARARLDVLRREAAFAPFPGIRDRYQALADSYAVSGSLPTTLSDSERKEFLAVQRLLSINEIQKGEK